MVFTVFTDLGAAKEALAYVNRRGGSIQFLSNSIINNIEFANEEDQLEFFLRYSSFISTDMGIISDILGKEITNQVAESLISVQPMNNQNLYKIFQRDFDDK